MATTISQVAKIEPLIVPLNCFYLHLSSLIILHFEVFLWQSVLLGDISLCFRKKHLQLEAAL